MANPTSERIGIPGFQVREPLPQESARVAYLFRNMRLRHGSQIVVAERTNPVPRFIGAAAWWVEGNSGRFQLACLRGSSQSEAAAVLVEYILILARKSGWECVDYADMLADGHFLQTVLQSHGFKLFRSERSFEISYGDAWNRVVRLYEKHRGRVPANWKATPIREHRPEAILDLIAPYRLLPAEEIRYYWRDTTVGGFDLDISSVLLAAERPFGAFLARRLADVLFVDVQVVVEANPRLRSLADVCQLYHAASLVAPGGPIRWIRLRSGEAEHRQTANLAVRMGGRELAPRHVFGRRLKE